MSDKFAFKNVLPGCLALFTFVTDRCSSTNGDWTLFEYYLKKTHLALGFKLTTPQVIWPYIHVWKKLIIIVGSRRCFVSFEKLFKHWIPAMNSILSLTLVTILTAVVNYFFYSEMTSSTQCTMPSRNRGSWRILCLHMNSGL